ncbi:MAG: phosphoglycerate mutase [Rhodanobacter sp.]
MTRERGPALELWLPPLAQFAAGGALLNALARADRLDNGTVGYLNRVAETFEGAAASLPVGALTRESIAHDAGNALWLAADPAWAQPDINGIRLMACGHLQLDMTESQALAAPLLELFAEAGMQLLVSTPERWHVRLPPVTVLPEFSTPEQALGEDLSRHLPPGPDGKRWRVLLNDVQVLLHQNPINRGRRSRQQPPVNTLWLWGGGRLPEQVQTRLQAVVTDDLLLGALAERAGIPSRERSLASIRTATAGWLIDLQDVPAAEIESSWWPALLPVLAGTALVCNFAAGERWVHRPWHRWRVWRRGER